MPPLPSSEVRQPPANPGSIAYPPRGLTRVPYFLCARILLPEVGNRSALST